MGRRIIESMLPDGLEEFGGYLANIPPKRARGEFERALPVTMEGKDFLKEYGGIDDTVVTVDPETEYAVRAPTMHPIMENDRCKRFESLLDVEPTSKNLAMLGEMMYLSHASYSACGLGSAGTDRIVEMVNEQGRKEGLYGARITGGGSGGTVAVLAATASEAIVEQIAAEYSREIDSEITIFRTDA